MLFCSFYWDSLQCTVLLSFLVVYVATVFTLTSLHLYLVCINIVFCELLFCLSYYGCPQCAFLPAALVVFMLLFAIAGAQWRITSADSATACSAAGVVEASKVRSKVSRKYKIAKTKIEENSRPICKSSQYMKAQITRYGCVEI